MLRRKLLALALCLLLLLAAAPGAGAAYIYPEHWSRPALVFAVENGILRGDSRQDLRPDEPITRAEMAAMLVRLLGAREQADLSAYRDVPAGAWYRQELAAAVAAGLFTGLSDDTMEPEAPITREQAATVLCRAFALYQGQTDAWQFFADAGQISGWARSAVGSLRAQELLQGYADGSFRPQGRLSRAEAAQLLYNLFDCVADSPEQIPARGRVLYRGTEPLPEELRLEGWLLLGPSTPPVESAAGWEIRGSLTLCQEGSQTLLGGSIDLLICAGPRALSTDAAQVLLLRPCRVDGSPDRLELLRGSALFLGSAGEICLWADTQLELQGQTQKLLLAGEHAAVSGPGSIGTLVRQAEHYSCSAAYELLDDVWQREYQQVYDRAEEIVRTAKVEITLTWDAPLYADRGLTELITTVPKGSLVYNEWNPAGPVTFISTATGQRGWTYTGYCNIHTDKTYVDVEGDFPQAAKEGWVDGRGYSSETEYLLWVSRYHQRVNLFRGSRGDWELVEVFRCSSGHNATPTPEGIHMLRDHNDSWSTEDYYVRYATIYNGDFAFHSLLYRYDGSFYDGRLDMPRSHGCVRLPIEAAEFIYGLPLGTTVVIY